ncbi:PEP-CTERM sorting domain-containing protein [Stieleria tagensis]|uniref:PEP-CTERM sorting domain-containing protein n=1 Tax=Stieleria tagensis TaxID=2956795 RepID=UPI00209AB98C|nr:PEP-CTERM sorting domain-containing protein [Stieleria tagensis]
MITYAGNSTDSTLSGASATAFFNFGLATPDEVGRRSIEVTISNTSESLTNVPLTSSFLTGLAFDTPAFGESSVVFDNSSYVGTSELGNVVSPDVAFNPFTAGGAPEFDIAFTDGSNIQGGGQPIDGLAMGDTITVSIEFTFYPVFETGAVDTSPSPTDIEAMFRAGFADGSLRTAVRFKAINPGGGSDKILGGPPTDPPTGDPPGMVPEPSSFAIFAALGLCGVASRRRRRVS